MATFSKRLAKRIADIGWQIETLTNIDGHGEESFCVAVPSSVLGDVVLVTVYIDHFGDQTQVGLFADTEVKTCNDLLAASVEKLINTHPQLVANCDGGSVNVEVDYMPDPDVVPVEHAIKAVVAMCETVHRAVVAAQGLVEGFYEREMRKNLKKQGFSEHLT